MDNLHDQNQSVLDEIIINLGRYYVSLDIDKFVSRNGVSVSAVLVLFDCSSSG